VGEEGKSRGFTVSRINHKKTEYERREKGDWGSRLVRRSPPEPGNPYSQYSAKELKESGAHLRSVVEGQIHKTHGGGEKNLSLLENLIIRGCSANGVFNSVTRVHSPGPCGGRRTKRKKRKGGVTKSWGSDGGGG